MIHFFNIHTWFVNFQCIYFTIFQWIMVLRIIIRVRITLYIPRWEMLAIFGKNRPKTAKIFCGQDFSWPRFFAAKIFRGQDFSRPRFFAAKIFRVREKHYDKLHTNKQINSTIPQFINNISISLFSLPPCKHSKHFSSDSLLTIDAKHKRYRELVNHSKEKLKNSYIMI